ncbi:MAG: glycosyl hydrolase 2 galactose-binding domain-containing protein, partial [Rhodanobacteraceae bacterium]
MTRVRRVEGNRRTALTRGWRFASAPADSTRDGLDALEWFAAEVPGTAAGALRAAGGWDFAQVRDFDAEDGWWRLRFHADPGPAVLGFDGLATLAEVWLDGDAILASDNMFRAHEVPVTLRGEHELVIRCRALEPELAKRRPRPRWRAPMLARQQLRWFRTTLLGRTPGWSPPCPAVGPWRGVWLESRALETGPVRLDARVAGTRGSVSATAKLDARVDEAQLIVERGSQRVSAPLALRDGHWQGCADIEDPALWWPHTHGQPALYRASLMLHRAADEVCVDLGAIGFRTFEIDRGDGDDFRVVVNGVPVFCRGACWTPLDPVTLNASPDAIRTAIAQAREAGMNMLRVGGTMVYEDDVFYDALDEAGILLWQDLMFANMDYPEDDDFVANALAEFDQQLARLHSHPSLTILCGNSEVEQQAAMSGAARMRWSPPLFHRHFAERAAAHGVPYTSSNATGGAFPHAADAGPTSYYGIGAYLRDFGDLRRSHVRFASECLAFANIPCDSGLPNAALRVHHPLWKARSPRDPVAGSDFDDVRDHYLQRLYDIDTVALRSVDYERYLALSRSTSGEVMARAFAEWRRPGSPTRGALIWFLRDLWPGAGWGVVDAHGDPKPCWYALKRALAPVTIAFTDEGVNGLALHVSNEPAAALDAQLEVALYRNDDIPVGRGQTAVHVPAHRSATICATSLFDEWRDLAWAYRFGPPAVHVIHATLLSGDSALADAFWFPAGLCFPRITDAGLAAELLPGQSVLRISTRRFAQTVSIHAPGYLPADNGFHLAPGQVRDVTLRPRGDSDSGREPARGRIAALNAETGVGFALPQAPAATAANHHESRQFERNLYPID